MKEQSSYWSEKPARRVEKNAFADLCSTYLLGKESLLDLGCGRGEDALHFASLGCSVTAVDISERNVDLLKEVAEQKHLSIRVVQQDISTTLPFGDASFDVIYAHLSVHYFDDAITKKVFADIHRVLKPGGLFFVKCKSIDDPLYGKGTQVGPEMFEDGHVRHFFSAEYMEECLSKFEIITLEKTTSLYVDYESAFIEAVARKPFS